LNFIGNIEGNDLAYGKANVVVCDGFVGNCVIKFFEGLNAVTTQWWTSKLSEKYSQAEAEELIAAYKKATTPPNTMGGVLWAVNGVVCKTHGHSRAADIARKVGTARKAVEMDLTGSLRSELAAVRSRLNLPAFG
jgi:phosphate acyltransferase